MKRVLVGAALTVIAPVLVCPSAQADTPNCASRLEYTVLHLLMSPTSVANLFDVSGWRIGETDNVFKRGYKP